MRKIKYYDRINHKMLELEVNDEVAKFLQADDRRQSRQGQKYRENVVLSLDDYSQVDGQNYLTYHELIADEKSNTIENYENKQFNKLVWHICHKLPYKERQILWWYYRIGYKASEIAKSLKLDNSQFSQQKATAISHLRILLLNDIEFTQTDFFKSTGIYTFPKQTKDTAKNLDVKNIEFKNEQIYELTKDIPQKIKVTEKLGVEIDDKIKNFGLLMNKEVRNFFHWLNGNDDLSRKFTLQDLLPNLVQYVKDTYNQDKDKRTISQIHKQMPIFKDNKLINFFVELYKPILLQLSRNKHRVKPTKAIIKKKLTTNLKKYKKFSNLYSYSLNF